MIEINVPESGFLTDSDREFNITTDIRDVEILRVSNINVIARGCRFGRIWLLKGLRPEMRDSSACRRQLQKEFEIHSRLHNPAVAQAVGFEEIPELGLCIIEEWIEGKTLAELLREGKLTGKERKKILREIIAAAGYLHSMGVIHRDLKPSNIMVRNAGKSVVLIDFGLADTDDYIELKQPAGTPGYISPEQMNDNSAAISDDIYSIGAIMRDLTPEYGAIIRRCTGALRKRPKDTAELQKMIARRERMPKYLLTSAVAACAIFIATLATLHILSLSDSANEAKRAISQARAATEDARSRIERLHKTNLKQQDELAVLTDSLSSVTNKMIDARNRLSLSAAYEEEKERAFNAGARAIDNLLAYYDRDVFGSSHFTSMTTAFTDSLNNLHKREQMIVDNSCDPTKYPSLTRDDRERIRAEMNSYYQIKLNAYHEGWLKRIYPDFENSNL